MGFDPYYEADGITLYHGDCREILPTLSPAVIVTDPPYGIAASSGWSAETRPIAGSIEGDADTSIRDFILASGVPIACFATWRCEFPTQPRALLIWDKGGNSGMGDLAIPWKPSFEVVGIFGDGWRGQRTSAVLRGTVTPNYTSGRRHPHEKPVWLFRELIGKAPPGLVADPCAGSGSSLVAAKELGREAVGIEIDEHYCEVAARRLRQRELPL